MTNELPPDAAKRAAEIGMQLINRAYRYMGDLIGVDTTDPLSPAFWWIYHTRCDCPLTPYHRWNCHLTPIWAQTMRDLDCNPWTVLSRA